MLQSTPNLFSLYLECADLEKDLLIAELWERGSAGITESDLPTGACGLRAFFNTEAEARSAALQFSAYAPQCRAEETRDWVEMARSRLEPLCVGSRFYLTPQWRTDPTPPGRFRIEVNPGMAFGTGAHESTQLCIETLEHEVRPGMHVLDVGAGSGILSVAAALLGAGRVIACDIDPVAVELAAQPSSFVGSVDAIRGASVDLLTANISPEAIIELAAEMGRALRPGGIAIVSGFERAEAAAVESALRASGLTLRASHAKGSWCALVAST